MEEPNTTIEVSLPKDLSSEIKSCENDYSCSSGRDSSGVSMPICFLVKEQAKSLIAIQELQRRLHKVESVQEDVIDAIIEFRNYLSDSKNISNVNPTTQISLNVTRTSNSIYSKLASTSELDGDNVPSNLESTVPNSAVKQKYFPKDCVHIYNDCGRTSAIASVPEQSPKHFELNKSKDSALESDKQDSGLDSDCHDIHPPISKNAPTSVNPESSDELLQLLDEIDHRSAILQKQLAVREENATLTDDMTAAYHSPPANKDDGGSPNHHYLEVSNKKLLQAQLEHSRFNATALYEEKVPISKQNSSGFAGIFETKPLCDKNLRKRVTNNIDSTTVSSILKETSIVDLQRQALVYLVDNAVLQAKLREAEQALSFKQLESEKVENVLKEEARLLMMENRELRISMDEQRLESHTMKSRVSMLERVLQSISNENQELNWQLGESLNLQHFPDRRLHNFSSSRSENSVLAPRSGSRSSLSLQNDPNIHCVKPKLRSKYSNFLDITAEDPEDGAQAVSTGGALKYRNGPIHSSTPFQKQKELKSNFSASISDITGNNFQTVKKCLRNSFGIENEDATIRAQKSGRCPDELNNSHVPAASNKKLSRSIEEETLQLTSSGKFPFNTILEKLKSNSEYRLSRSPSTKTNEQQDNFSNSVRSVPDKSKSSSAHENSNVSHNKETRSSQLTSSESRRKGQNNIQQRIQNILDRIVAESEEAS